ncbi:MAG: discoidin domain-containing protein [Patescibacteria group bacterium]
MNKNIKYLGVIVFVGIIAWYQTLGFWFFKGYEASWLTGVAPYTVINLIKGHGFLYFIDYKIFGWNPLGWYATSLLFHIIASSLAFYFIFLLSRNKLLAFVASLFFVASTSYNDVLTWGSFNSYYPFLLSLMLLTLICYHKFRETKLFLFFSLSLLFSFLGFFVRETGIIIVLLLLVYEIVFSKNIKNPKSILTSLKYLSPFIIILILFFVLRSGYGGTGGDGADSNVKLQMRFIKDGLYLEYAKASILTFGKLIPPQIIPYPLLNLIKEILSHVFNPAFIANYFFSFLGFIFFGALGAITYLLKKNKNYFKIALFSLLWIFAFSLFVSLAVPSTNEVLIRDYDWNLMRYRYFAFMGTSVMLGILAILFSEILKPRFGIRKAKIVSVALILGIVFINLFLIWKIEKYVYAAFYKPQKEFYASFKNYFPKLPDNAVFYINPNASGLGDYLSEWFLTKGSSYPNLVGKPFRVESQIVAVMDKIKKGEIALSDVFFLDYDERSGLLNKTQDVRDILQNQKDYPLSFLNPKENYFTGILKDSPKIEFPYDLEISLNLKAKGKFMGSQPDSERFRSLVDYSTDRNDYLSTVSIDTAPTASQRPGEPFFFTRSSNLIDGNTGLRSKWIADSWTPWIQVDLGKTMEIIAVSWGSLPDSIRIPATYSIFASEDGNKWQIVKTVKNFKGSSSIDVLEKPVMARYIKMEIHTTSGGDFVLLDEFEVITSRAKKVLDLYKDRGILLDDLHDMFKFVSSREDLDYIYQSGINDHWGKLTWETNKTLSSGNDQYWYFPYRLDEKEQKINVHLPEAEIYAGKGQFLKKYITSLSLDFGQIPFIIDVSSLRLIPRENLK